MTKIKVEIEYNDEELMDSVLHNIWRHSSPWIVEYAYGSFDEDKVIPITYVDENDEVVSTTFTILDIAAGLEHVFQIGYHHCGEEVSRYLGDWDCCVSDMVLQAAIFGKVIYG